jgi:YVTN family beta-propeller protein
VPVGTSGSRGVAITPNGAFAYVTNSRDNTVSVIDTATNTVVATVPAGTGPNAIAITPSGAFAYVVNDQAVSVISTATNTVVTTVPVPAGNGATDGPGVAITPNGAFVSISIRERNISVVSTAINTVVATVSTTENTRGSNLYYMAFTPNGTFGYAAVAGFNEVAVFDTTNAVVAAVPVGSFPVGVAITPNGAFAYVTNNHDNTVSVIDTAANAVVATVSVGVNPLGVAITRSLDNDSQFSLLNGSNTFTDNQTVNGNVSATNFVGNCAGLTGVAAVTATNASQLGGVGAGNYARLDIGNTFSGNEAIMGTLSASGSVFGSNVTAANSVFATNVAATGNVTASGSVTIGTAGTPILGHLSATFNPSFPALKPSTCATANTGLTGASDGDTLALGVPNARTTGGGTIVYFAWVSVANTITVQACNIGASPQKTAGSGVIRVDLWKH